MRFARRFAVVSTVCAMLVAGPAVAGNNQSVGETIKSFITSGNLNLGKSMSDQLLFQIFTFYEDRNFKPIWTRDSGVKGKGKALLRALTKDWVSLPISR